MTCRVDVWNITTLNMIFSVVTTLPCSTLIFYSLILVLNDVLVDVLEFSFYYSYLSSPYPY